MTILHKDKIRSNKPVKYQSAGINDEQRDMMPEVFLIDRITRFLVPADRCQSADEMVKGTLETNDGMNHDNDETKRFEEINHINPSCML